MFTPPSAQAQVFPSVGATPEKKPKVLNPTRTTDPNIAWDTMEADRFTFPTGLLFDIDMDVVAQPPWDHSGEPNWQQQWEPLPELNIPQFKVHDFAVYHPDPNLQALACSIVDVHPVLTGQVAIYTISFADGSMRLSVPQYDLHDLYPNIGQ